MQPPEGPPVWTALNALLCSIPPPISYMISLRGIPIGTSISPEFLILPVSAKTLVPLLFSVPNDAYQSEPFLIMEGTFARVSTLFRHVGRFQRPASVERGGVTLGMP